MTSDPAAFLARLHDYRRAGAQALRDSGADPDPILAEEVRAPGADQRYGVNLIACPPLPVVEAIAAIQARLSALEPGQYYYPASDLHLTLVEVCSSQGRDAVEQLAAAISQIVPDLVAEAPQAVLARPLLGYDRRACALNFVPVDHGLQTLRAHLVAQLAGEGIAIAPRYPAQSAHVTLMRYLRPLTADRAGWVSVLESISPPALEWRVDSLWLTWGATWYGRTGRVQMHGPYALGGTPLSG